ncbi:MAG: CsbD family protein [Actinomycetota bacterium]
MSIFDKIKGKAKQVAGDVGNDPSLRKEGRDEEAKGEAKDSQMEKERAAEAEKDRVDDLERRT